MKREYEKPMMTATSLQSEEMVANICWGGSGITDVPSKKILTWAYYGKDHVLNGKNDTDEGAWFYFQIDARNCQGATADNVVIKYQGTAVDGELTKSGRTDYESQQKLFTEFTEECNVSNAGSPWSGEGTVTPILSSF